MIVQKVVFYYFFPYLWNFLFIKDPFIMQVSMRHEVFYLILIDQLISLFNFLKNNVQFTIFIIIFIFNDAILFLNIFLYVKVIFSIPK